MSSKRSTNSILDIPYQVRWSMPYMVHAQWPSRSEQSQSAMVEVLGREYDVLHVYRADRLRRPSPSMFRLWAESKNRASGRDADEDGSEHVRVWLYTDAGRDIQEYLRALQPIGKWLKSARPVDLRDHPAFLKSRGKSIGDCAQRVPLIWLVRTAAAVTKAVRRVFERARDAVSALLAGTDLGVILTSGGIGGGNAVLAAASDN